MTDGHSSPGSPDRIAAGSPAPIACTSPSQCRISTVTPGVHGLGRFLVELIRIDTVERYAGLSRNNWVALLVALGGLVGLLRLRAAGPGPDAGDAPTAATDDAGDAGDAAETGDADRPAAEDGTSAPPGDATAS